MSVVIQQTRRKPTRRDLDTAERERERSPTSHNTQVCDVNWWIVKSPKAFRHCPFLCVRFEKCFMYRIYRLHTWYNHDGGLHGYFLYYYRLLCFYLFLLLSWKSFEISKKWNGIETLFSAWVDPPSWIVSGMMSSGSCSTIASNRKKKRKIASYFICIHMLMNSNNNPKNRGPILISFTNSLLFFPPVNCNRRGTASTAKETWVRRR